MDRSKARASALAALLALVLLLAACSSGDDKGGNQAGGTSKPTTSQAVITVSADPAKPINVKDPVVVTVQGGDLKNVTVTNPSGVQVKGIVTPDNQSWKTIEPLGYAATYQVHAEATDANGLVAVKDSAVTTLAPGNQTQLYLETTSGDPLADGATYGVGMVVVAHFDEAISNKVAAEKAMTVTTDPPVAGAWHWFDDKHAHWRPERYYAPNTKVTVEGKLYGVDVGDGIFGQSDIKTGFRIGDAHISTADDNTKQVTVTNNGNVVRTMPTSMGQGGTETVGGTTLSFWTPRGTYTVMGKANPVIMDSATYGLPINSRLGYKVTVPWATRISSDGIYLHQLDETIWAQGNTNTSHGCLNLNGDNARWFYEFSLIGDVVQVINTGGPPQAVTNNGDWDIPWQEWTAGGGG